MLPYNNLQYFFYKFDLFAKDNICFYKLVIADRSAEQANNRFDCFGKIF